MIVVGMLHYAHSYGEQHVLLIYAMIESANPFPITNVFQEFDMCVLPVQFKK